MNRKRAAIIYTMSFLSGAAALLYEICWFRSLSLVVGGTQMAVTTTVTVFMLGLALGNWLSARYAQRAGNQLRLYGLLELGIALSALLFLAMMRFYPALYAPLARIAPDSLFYLTAIRSAFSAAAMLLPATLMGATLPVLTGSISRDPDTLSKELSLLYGLNTIGAVAGAAATGFLLLRVIPVSAVMLLAAAVNLTVGLVSLMLREETIPVAGAGRDEGGRGETAGTAAPDPLVPKLVLWGIGISGFCALGYEVLWTRILVLFLGATVYSFTLILVAFLLGMGLGSSAYRACQPTGGGRALAASALGFGVAQMLIGISTLLVMRFLLHIPAYSVLLQRLFSRSLGGDFVPRQAVNFILAFGFLAVPAFLMGLSIPLAGRVVSGWRRTTGRSAGELLTYNTVGAVLGGALGGSVFIAVLGIERSVQALCLVNICTGAVVTAAVKGRNWAAVAAVVLCTALGAVLIAAPDRFRYWDRRFLATYTPDQAVLYADEERSRQQIDNHEVLYYAEGFDAIVSSTLRKDTGTLQFTVNGRPEASTNLEDVQNQYMLGHLPMLLHRDPKKALVIGAGSGMTLASVSRHPGLAELRLVEIEPKVLGVARAFREYNHRIIDDPDLKITYDDARNYLLATTETFDVITADPIHPIWRGSGYLYTTEYFKLAAERLSRGGIMCQWLPLYLLSGENIKSVIRTFSRNFKYSMVWITMDDVQLIGSNDPLLIDPNDIDRRIKVPAVYEDLNAVFMGSADELMSYFLMGNTGVEAFAREGTVNTDENLYLEFSSPRTIGERMLGAANAATLARYREDIGPYLVRPQDRRVPHGDDRGTDGGINEVADRAQSLYLTAHQDKKQMESLRAEIGRLHPTGRLKSLQVGLFGYE